MKTLRPTARLGWLICAILASLTAFFSAVETQAAMKIPGLPGGLPGGLPPFLLTSVPMNGQKNVSVDTTVTFTFLSAMAPMQSIAWSANVTAANFTYVWSADGKTLTCTYRGGFPATSTITWTLDPTVFQDTSGTALMAVNNSGAFTTGSSSGTTGPCNGGSTNNGTGSVALLKNASYVQTSASAPTLDTENGPTFLASASAATNTTISAVTIQLPNNGASKTLTNLFGHWLFYEQFTSEQSLDAAYPAGTYKVTMKLTTGSAVFNLNLAANGAVPTPQISNFAPTQAFDPTADFTLQWLPFTGVAPIDGINLDLSDAAGNTFAAPDLCIPRPLANTATSIVVPKNTFASGAIVDGSLGFNKISTLDTNSVPKMVALSAYSKTTKFTMQNGGVTPPVMPVLQNLVRQPDGTVQFQVKANPGSSLTVKGSSDLNTWSTIVAAPTPASGVLDVTDTQAKSITQRFYQAIAQ